MAEPGFRSPSLGPAQEVRPTVGRPPPEDSIPTTATGSRPPGGTGSRRGSAAFFFTDCNVKIKLLWGGKRFSLDVNLFPLAVAFGGRFGDLEGVSSGSCIGLSFLGRS